ncbi:N-acetylneuraminate lyase B-like [Contarinia nasturtii]|uniref:N-acetylneuraminate lyase B-like n=1 Tax=Contarinia nasturtii TaxID=265458 RepID=UPI0012D3CBE6|nr:N-acetylneuraminate lyase B-like [Contarinia nasturtii]
MIFGVFTLLLVLIPARCANSKTIEMKTDFNFKGMMVPVFTPFNNDAKRTINYDVIDKYCQYLKSKGMHGVFVNSMTGEGLTLTVEERKKLSEKWFVECSKYELKVVVNIGGLPLPYVYELAEHAEKIKIDAVMIIPDMYHKPKTAENLVYYLKDVKNYMPTRPIFYYHIPKTTGVENINWYGFLQLMKKEVSTFAGLFWAVDHIDQAIHLKEKMPEYNYIIAMGSSIMGYMAEGFEAISMTVMNLYPELVKEVYDNMTQYKMQEAYDAREKLYKTIYDLFAKENCMDDIYTMKKEMDKLYPFKMGPVRKPNTCSIESSHIQWQPYH